METTHPKSDPVCSANRSTAFTGKGLRDRSSGRRADGDRNLAVTRTPPAVSPPFDSANSRDSSATYGRCLPGRSFFRLLVARRRDIAKNESDKNSYWEKMARPWLGRPYEFRLSSTRYRSNHGLGATLSALSKKSPPSRGGGGGGIRFFGFRTDGRVKNVKNDTCFSPPKGRR